MPNLEAQGFDTTEKYSLGDLVQVHSLGPSGLQRIVNRVREALVALAGTELTVGGVDGGLLDGEFRIAQSLGRD